MSVLDNYVCDGQISLFDLPTEPTKPIQIPCNRECEYEWGSLECFLKRGYIRHDGKWVRNSDGEPLRLKNKECDWMP